MNVPLALVTGVWTSLALLGAWLQWRILRDALEDRRVAFARGRGLAIVATLHVNTAAIKLGMCLASATVGAATFAIPPDAPEWERVMLRVLILSSLLLLQGGLAALGLLNRRARKAMLTSGSAMVGGRRATDN